MLYNPQPEQLQLRQRCRSPRCGATLKIPAANPRDAFCCRACERRFYSCRCRVCESLLTKKSQRRQVCGRSRCRHELERHPGPYFRARFPRADLGHNAKKTGTRYPPPGLGHNALAKPIKTGVPGAAKSGRAYRIIAGPAADPINFGNWPDLPKPRRVLIGRTTPPVNVIGGYRFPDAPKVDLSSTHADQAFRDGRHGGQRMSAPQAANRATQLRRTSRKVARINRTLAAMANGQSLRLQHCEGCPL